MNEFREGLTTAINNYRLAVYDFEAAKKDTKSEEQLPEYFDTIQRYAGVLAVYEVFFTPEEMLTAREEASAGLDELIRQLQALGRGNDG